MVYPNFVFMPISCYTTRNRRKKRATRRVKYILIASKLTPLEIFHSIGANGIFPKFFEIAPWFPSAVCALDAPTGDTVSLTQRADIPEGRSAL